MNTLTCQHGRDLRREQCIYCEGFTKRAKHHQNLRTLRAARAAVAPELNRPIIEQVADKILEELNNDQDSR
jgi:diphthamide biosynthesis methyltransferase